MSGRSWGRDAGLVAGLTLLYLVVFVASGAFLAPDGIELGPGSAEAASQPSPVAESAAPPTRQLVAGVGIALVDTLLFCWLARRSLMTGWRLWLSIAAMFFGVKTFTSQLEAWFFMATIDGPLAARLSLMWVPLALIWSAGVVWAFGHRAPGLEGGSEMEEAEDPALRSEGRNAPGRGRLYGGGALLARVALLSAVVYPALFVGFGQLAWQSDDVRNFYLEPRGGVENGATMPSRAEVYRFETMRGALWVAMALPVLLACGTRLERGLLLGLVFALVQNNVLWLSNPLMPGEVRFWHFWETSSSNLVWGFVIAFVLCLPASRR